jgi:hypothetical protein
VAVVAEVHLKVIQLGAVIITEAVVVAEVLYTEQD